MSHTDLTKPTSHIYWLWAAYVALAGAILTGYLSLQQRRSDVTNK